MGETEQCDLRPKDFYEMSPAEQVESLKNSVTNLNRNLESLVKLVDRLAEYTQDDQGISYIEFYWPLELDRLR